MQREITKSLAFLLLFCCAASLRAQTPDSVIFPGSFIKQDTLKAWISSLIRMGNAHLEQEDTELARETFEKALKLDSTDPRI